MRFLIFIRYKTVTVFKFFNAYSQPFYLFLGGPTLILVPNFCKALLQTAVNLDKRSSVLNTIPFREPKLLFSITLHTRTIFKSLNYTTKLNLLDHIQQLLPIKTGLSPTNLATLAPRTIKNWYQRQSIKRQKVHTKPKELPFRAHRRRSLQALLTVLA